MTDTQLPVLKIAKPGWPVILSFLGITAMAITWAIYYKSTTLGFLGLASFLLLAITMWFYRDPDRKINAQQLIALGGSRKPVIAPADGRLTDMTDIKNPDSETTLRLGFFLSPLNVHVQWVPIEGKVIVIERKNGKCLPAYKPEAAHENAMVSVLINNNHLGPCAVRQITGFLARRILTWTHQGAALRFGQRLGMILLGSRVELDIPKDKIKLQVSLGQMVYAGKSVIASYESKI
ncbi:MAG: phosphatidylserine decarboxylase [Elusimicrobia bacterium]|nr:phosphatidylserine decarboxylase [Elusimicrobiota bacterium]